MSENTNQRAQKMAERMKQTAKLAASILPPKLVGEWVAERITQGQDISIVNLEQWIAELLASDNPVSQGKGESLSEWLEKCRSNCS